MQDLQAKFDQTEGWFEREFSSIVKEKNGIIKDYEKALKKAKSR